MHARSVGTMQAQTQMPHAVSATICASSSTISCLSTHADNECYCQCDLSHHHDVPTCCKPKFSLIQPDSIPVQLDLPELLRRSYSAVTVLTSLSAALLLLSLLLASPTSGHTM